MSSGSLARGREVAWVRREGVVTAVAVSAGWATGVGSAWGGGSCGCGGAAACVTGRRAVGATPGVGGGRGRVPPAAGECGSMVVRGRWERR